MGQALYRKYRSRSLDEVVGQEHITTTLKNAIKNNTISHAYLFTGPRGVGKTSVARILAHEVNKLPYANERTHLDIIEIDAASNRGIDEIRDLRDRVYVSPTQGAYKVYIIDEVHMLTPQAFNALLKTLEEPPAHVIFILATTEVNKLPDTIISRTQRFNFLPIDIQKIVNHLKMIADKEKIDVDSAALLKIAQYGQGSFRDSIGLLDQLGADKTKKITAETVLKTIGQVDADYIEQMIAAIYAGDITKIVSLQNELIETGNEPQNVASQIINSLREDIINQNTPINITININLISKLIEVPASLRPALSLEISLIEAAYEYQNATRPASATNFKTKEHRPSTPNTSNKISTEQQPTEPNTKSDTTKQSKPRNKPNEVRQPKANLELNEELWPKILERIKVTHNTLYGIIQSGKPSFTSTGLDIIFHYTFHQKRMKEPKNIKIISDTINELTGKSIVINCILDSAQGTHEQKAITKNNSVEQDTPESNPLNTISNIFGGAELLES